MDGADPAKPFLLSWGESLIAKSEQSSVSSTMETFWMGTVSELVCESVSECNGGSEGACEWVSEWESEWVSL